MDFSLIQVFKILYRKVIFIRVNVFKAHPGKCVYDKLILSPGEEAKLPGMCGVISCGEGSFATIQT